MAVFAYNEELSGIILIPMPEFGLRPFLHFVVPDYSLLFSSVWAHSFCS